MDYFYSPRLEKKEGEILGDKYRIISQYSPGRSANVYRCVNLTNKTEVAIKCFRNHELHEAAAIKALQLYNELFKNPDAENHFSKIIECFVHDGHYCIVMQRYGADLYTVMRFHHFHGWRSEVIRQILYQLIQSLKMLKSAGRLHGDIKLENILIDPDVKLTDKDIFIDQGAEQPKELQIKLIDMETTHNFYSWGYGNVTTIYYRAPETMLGLPWGKEIDIWALGCLALEMVFGRIPFGYSEEDAYLFAIQHTIGKIPDKMLNDCTIRRIKSLVDHGYINPKFIKKEFTEKIFELQPLYKLEIEPDLHDLILKMLSIDPFQRPTLEEILEHPYMITAYQ